MILKKELFGNRKIQKIGITEDCLSGRSGISLFAEYLRHIPVMGWLVSRFGKMKKNSKGLSVPDILFQMLCFFMDGTNLSLVQFDNLKKDEGYAASVGYTRDKMASSHAIKRLLQKSSGFGIALFNQIFLQLFIWRLKMEKPDHILIDVDTVVFDNDDAHSREGVSPTYKKVKGFQPLLFKWNRYVVSASFRSGKHHSNHDDTVLKRLRALVKAIRTQYSSVVPVTLNADSGFYDQENFKVCEDELNISYVVVGKMYADIRSQIEEMPEDRFCIYNDGENEWRYCEFMDRRGTWDRSRRVIYKTLYSHKGQLCLGGHTERVLYTNICITPGATKALYSTGGEDLIDALNILKTAHGRGENELLHRHIKEFGGERMPFKKFAANAFWFNMMILAFNLMEAYKYDCLEGIVKRTCYPSTVRRTFIDFAGKIVRHAGQIVLKVRNEIENKLQIYTIWRRAQKPRLC